MSSDGEFLSDITDVSGARWYLLHCLKSYLCEYKYLGFGFTLISLTTDF